MEIELGEDILVKIKETLRQVGNELLDIQNKSIIKFIYSENEYKNDPQLHTSGDEYSEEKIISCLKSLTNYTCYTEETGVGDSESGWVWVLDPIDGSTQFQHGLPLFTISLALCHGRNLDPYWGLVYAPSLNLMYEATRDKGAFCNGIRMCNNKNKELDHLFISVSAYRSFERVKRIDFFEKVLVNIKQIRQLGCPSLDICFVAEGKLDARIIAGYKVWDVAAAFLIAKESQVSMIDPISLKEASLFSDLAIFSNKMNMKTLIKGILND